MADVGGDKSSFDPIELQCSSIPFNDPFRFVAGEFGEWPEPEPSRTTEHQTIANSLCDDWDLELSRTAQSQRWRKAGVNRIGTKLESSYDSFAAASTDNLMLLHNCTRPSTHAPQVPASAPLATSQDSGDAFTVTTGVRPFSESKEKYDLCSYGSLKLAKLSNPMAPASPSLFDMASQMPCRHVELFSYYTACKSASSSRMEDKVTGERLNPANNESQGRDREIFVHSLPVVLPGRARLNPEQAINIFKQRATKTRPDTGDGAAHGGSDERHAAKNLVSTSTTGLIHVYAAQKEAAFDHCCYCDGADERAWVKSLSAFSWQWFGPVLDPFVSEFGVSGLQTPQTHVACNGLSIKCRSTAEGLTPLLM